MFTQQSVRILVLPVCVFLCTLLVTLTFFGTRETIAQSENKVLEDRLRQLVPLSSYDNNLIEDRLAITSPLLGSTQPQTIWRARLGGTPVAAVISAIAPDGYGGPIRLLVGIRYGGEISSVRVIKHSETPGLGDDIEISRSDWINGFAEKSLENLTDNKWRVKKEGGDFDQFTGATITPRAVISAIHSTLRFYKDNRAAIFARPASKVNTE